MNQPLRQVCIREPVVAGSRRSRPSLSVAIRALCWHNLPPLAVFTLYEKLRPVVHLLLAFVDGGDAHLCGDVLRCGPAVVKGCYFRGLASTFKYWCA